MEGGGKWRRGEGKLVEGGARRPEVSLSKVASVRVWWRLSWREREIRKRE